MSCLFNSYDPYFKQPFGALRAGQTVRLTLCIPEELGYVDPHLVLQKEGKYDVPVHYRMKFDGQTPQQNHFSVELPLNDPGLYFYYFDLYTDFRRIYRGPDNCGVVSWQEGEKWQITVYDAGFQTPECIKGKVFYQIFPDRFCEGIENKPMPFPDRLYQADKHAEPFWQPNETGGHLNEDYFGGDLEGIRIKLPYLREMGVDYLYLNPISVSYTHLDVYKRQHLGGAVARQLRCNFTDQRCHCQILTDDRIGTAGCNGTDGLFQRGQLAAIDGGVQRHMNSHAPRMAEGDRIFQRIRVKIVGTGAGIETRKTQIHCVSTAEYSGTQHFFVAHRGKDLDL